MLLRSAEENKDDALRARLIRWFNEAEEAGRESRQKAERDVDYYDGKQLTADEVNELKSRGQPPISINLIRRKIDFLRGMEVRQRSDPKAWPRTPADADSAEIATDTLRYVFDTANYNSQTRKWVWKDLLVAGWGGVQLQLKPGRHDKVSRMLGVNPNKRLAFKRTPWDRMFWDPHSSEHDFADARYRGLVLWMDKAAALDFYRDNEKAREIIESTMDAGRVGETFDDKPRSAWVDSDRRRIRIIQIWWKELGDVMWAEATAGGILDGGPSPFADEYGDPCDGFIWQSCYVDRDNNRHGIVRDMIDPQDEVNKRRSKSMHLLAVRQVIADDGAVNDVEKAKRQLARPDGWITKMPGLELEIVQNGDLSAGQMQLLQHATTELEKMGPNESLQGRGAATSGRDRQAQQQGGMIELGPMMDDLMWVDQRCYTLAWSTVQTRWTAPQFIRVTDNENAPKFIGLNEPLVDEATGQIAGSQNKPAEINVDIIIQPTPDAVTLEQEVWTDFTQILPVLATLPPNMQEFTIQLSPLPSSRKRLLIDILKQGAQQPQVDPAVQQMQQRAAEAEIAGKEATAADKAASAQLKQVQARRAMVEPVGGQPEAPEQASPMEMASTAADIDLKRAQAVNTRADAATKMANLMRPQQPTEPGALR